MTESTEVQLQILKKLNEMSIELKKLDPLCVKVEKLSMEISSISESLNKKICEVEKRSENTEAEVRELKMEISKNKKIMDRIEADQKRCNVILYNFDPKIRGSSLKEDILRCLNEIVRGARFMQTDIKDVFRLPSNQKVKPVVIKLASMELKKSIFTSAALFKRFHLSVAPDYTSSDLLARSKLIPILEAARTEGHLRPKLRGVRLFVGDKIFAYDSELGKVKEIYREQRKVIAVEEIRTHDHQSSDLNRNMRTGNEVMVNASSLSNEGSKSVTLGIANEVKKEKHMSVEVASPNVDSKEPGTSYARANQINQIISRERSGSVNSAASCQSFGSAASVFSVEDGDPAAFICGQYYPTVSQEPAVDLAQQSVRRGKRNNKNISPLEQDKGAKKSARETETIQDYESFGPRQIVKAPVFLSGAA